MRHVIATSICLNSIFLTGPAGSAVLGRRPDLTRTEDRITLAVVVRI